MKQEMAVEHVDVGELLERRATIQGWLERLEAQRGTVSPKVVERVRADYEERLRDTTEALAAHREDIARQLVAATESLDRAEQAHADAVEALEEGRLRSAIGELDEETWAEERTRLEADVRTSADREATARAEAVRLRDLLDQLEAREAKDQSNPLPPFELETPGPAGESSDVTAPAREDEPELAFLADIDRALSDGAAKAPRARSDDDEPDPEKVPKPGVKCGECGYTNDLGAWFCGVCGADVG